MSQEASCQSAPNRKRVLASRCGAGVAAEVAPGVAEPAGLAGACANAICAMQPQAAHNNACRIGTEHTFRNESRIEFDKEVSHGESSSADPMQIRRGAQ